MGTRKHEDTPPSSSILDALDAAGSRPPDDADQQSKRKYAERLSHALARKLEADLQRRLGSKTIKAGESKAGSASGTKKLDVNYSDELHGLKLGISIKTISHRDKSGRGTYTKNRKRVDEEFLAEALDYHRRQPYAVLIGLYYLPEDACDDFTDRRTSSFGQWVEKLYWRSGRRDPRDNPELFERIFVGLFDATADGPRGQVRFFDVATPPPKRGRPAAGQTKSWTELLDEIEEEHRRRNDPFRWGEDGEVVGTIPIDERPGESDEDD